MQAKNQNVGNPLRDMIITAGQRLQDYLESYKQSKKGVQDEDDPAVSISLSEADAAWEKLQKLFSEVDERQNVVQKLQVNIRTNLFLLGWAFLSGCNVLCVIGVLNVIDRFEM